MQLTDDLLKKWEDIVDQVDKEHIPIECVKKIVFRIVGGKQKTINIRRLKDQGLESDEIHNVVDRFVQENSDNIVNMEFVLDIVAVAELLQPETDKLLQGML
jgi:hypothetical protein